MNRDRGFVFTPGQFARIGIRKESGEIIWRAYSIVSAPHERFLEFFLVVLPTGEFSSRAGKFVPGIGLADPLEAASVPQQGDVEAAMRSLSRSEP